MGTRISALRQRVEDHVEARKAMAERLTAELAGRRFVAESGDGLVIAEVDYTGRLLDLRFDRTSLTRVTGRAVGAGVVEAVTRAQADAHRTVASTAPELAR